MVRLINCNKNSARNFNCVKIGDLELNELLESRGL